ncbi:MAG: hypothetical protein M1812_000603 [Candelaria pacifica]|nr:MAG: hypothetical protein M1812_000603 [Candelaria pacifica]
MASNDSETAAALQPVIPFVIPYIQPTSEEFKPVEFTSILDFRCAYYNIVLDMRYLKLCLATQLWAKFPETMTQAIYEQYEQKLAHEGVTEILVDVLVRYPRVFLDLSTQGEKRLDNLLLGSLLSHHASLIVHDNKILAFLGDRVKCCRLGGFASFLQAKANFRYSIDGSVTEKQKHAIFLTQTRQNQWVEKAMTANAGYVIPLQVPVSGFYEQEDHLYVRSVFQEITTFVGDLTPVAQDVITAMSIEAKAVSEHHNTLSAKKDRELVDYATDRSFKIVDYAIGRGMMLVNLSRLEGMKVVDHFVAGLKEVMRSLGKNVVFVVFWCTLIFLGYRIVGKVLDL